MVDRDSRQAVILSGARTAMGKILGGLSSFSAPQLGAFCIREAVARAGIDPATVDEVLMGQVVQAGSGQAPARQAGISAGVPPTVGATTVNKICGSGLKTVMLAAGMIRAGDGDLYIAGGQESMSQAPFFIREGRTGHKFGHTRFMDALLHDGLWCAFEDQAMGVSAEFIADQYDITREQMDEFAYHSHQKAVAAAEEGRFDDEIVPIEVKGRRGQTTIVNRDESPRRDTSLAALAKLRPAFVPDGKVTAGNSPGLNDGAAALVVASRARADELDAKPLARIIGYAQSAVEPLWLFQAPALAIPKLLHKVGWKIEDVDLMEINEAFAAQILADIKHLEREGYEWDWENRLNVSGGGVAMGHPIGCSGARVLVTLIYALRQRGLRRGVAALCLGGGEAVAMAIELED